MSRDLYEDHDFRREVCAWLVANGIEPARTPMDPHASVTDGQLTFRRIVLSELTGTPMLDPEEPNQLATETVTVPVVVDPPPDVAEWLRPDVAEWLRPKCPTCGR